MRERRREREEGEEKGGEGTRRRSDDRTQKGHGEGTFTIYSY